ncbi:signal peptidase I [Sinomonas sp. ASV322]|uniref:signal peptidase I n=1 Tax=Sinomonas sp. ASV322 TaxID=3041920 RepID=UPI0027DC8280|nr:signal peptidase I [Sinomonas sp. ASV322]MDQ4502266.1 signal peptidase I [Sinomonas sp. ASV322]
MTSPADSERGTRTERRPRLLGWRSALLGVFAALLVGGLARAFIVDVFYVPSGSMEPLLAPGDRIAVSRTAFAGRPVARGDVVVFDGRGSLAPLESGRGWIGDAVWGVGAWLGVVPNETAYVKRVVGVAGDHVACCAADGRLTINGVPLAEPYLYPGDAPSDVKFDVVVPQGRLWLLGDHRSDSVDSRSLLGAPGGGLIRTDRVIGEPVAILWPLDRLGEMSTMKGHQ